MEARHVFELAVGLLAATLLVGLVMPSNVWADEITGTDGNDNLLGTKNPDTISGLAGDDKIDSKEVRIRSTEIEETMNYMAGSQGI